MSKDQQPIERDLRTFEEIAAEISRTKFPCSRRSLARWEGLETRVLNKRRLASLKQAITIADRMIADAPAIGTDRRRGPKLKAIS